jgi:hypothetical protein
MALTGFCHLPASLGVRLIFPDMPGVVAGAMTIMRNDGTNIGKPAGSFKDGTLMRNELLYAVAFWLVIVMGVLLNGL